MINATAGNVMYQYVKKSVIADTMKKMSTVSVMNPMSKATASAMFTQLP